MIWAEVTKIFRKCGTVERLGVSGPSGITVSVGEAPTAGASVRMAGAESVGPMAVYMLVEGDGLR